MVGALPFHFDTLNVSGLRSKRWQCQKLHLLHDSNVNAVAIQETKI